MAIYKNETVLYVRLFNNMYYFFVSESDRNANVNFIYQSIKLPTGVNVTFDFNHISHTNNRLVFAVEDTKHEQINANYVPGVSDYSKLIFDQGAFGQISGVQPFMVVGSNPYTGVLKVFSANVLGANISSSILIEVESAMKSIGGASNTADLIATNPGGADITVASDQKVYDITGTQHIFVSVVDGKIVFYRPNVGNYFSNGTGFSTDTAVQDALNKLTVTEGVGEKISGSQLMYNGSTSTPVGKPITNDIKCYFHDGAEVQFIMDNGVGIDINSLVIQSTPDHLGSDITDASRDDVLFYAAFDATNVTKTIETIWNVSTEYPSGEPDATKYPNQHIYIHCGKDGGSHSIMNYYHDSAAPNNPRFAITPRAPDLEFFVNKDGGDIKIYQPDSGSHFDTTTAPSTWTTSVDGLLKAGTKQIGTLVDKASHARMFVEGSNVRFYYTGFDLSTSKLILSRNKNGSSPIFTQESKISDTWVVPVNDNAFSPRDYSGLREQALYVYDTTTPIIYYNESGPSNVEIYGHGLVNGVVFHTISPGLPLCFHENTPIMTEHGKVPIKDLKRGTMVQTLNGLKPLARLMINEYIIFGQEFVKFPAHCLGENVPTTDVLCTREHPLMFKFKTIAAKEFVGKVKGVEIVHSTSNQYNLLFEEQEYINIEGITFVSHHPNHSNNSLKIEEYFNPMKFRPGVFKEKLFKFEELQLVV